jgi:hypothetical protein
MIYEQDVDPRDDNARRCDVWPPRSAIDAVNQNIEHDRHERWAKMTS